MPLKDNQVLAHVVIDREEYEELKQAAKRDLRSFSSWALMAIREQKRQDDARYSRRRSA